MKITTMSIKLKTFAKAVTENIKQQPLMSKAAFIVAMIGLIKAFMS